MANSNVKLPVLPEEVRDRRVEDTLMLCTILTPASCWGAWLSCCGAARQRCRAAGRRPTTPFAHTHKQTPHLKKQLECFAEEELIDIVPNFTLDEPDNTFRCIGVRRAVVVLCAALLVRACWCVWCGWLCTLRPFALCARRVQGFIIINRHATRRSDSRPTTRTLSL